MTERIAAYLRLYASMSERRLWNPSAEISQVPFDDLYAAMSDAEQAAATNLIGAEIERLIVALRRAADTVARRSPTQ